MEKNIEQWLSKHMDVLIFYNKVFHQRGCFMELSNRCIIAYYSLFFGKYTQKTLLFIIFLMSAKERKVLNCWCEYTIVRILITRYTRGSKNNLFLWKLLYNGQQEICNLFFIFNNVQHQVFQLFSSGILHVRDIFSPVVKVLCRDISKKNIQKHCLFKNKRWGIFFITQISDF